MSYSKIALIVIVLVTQILIIILPFLGKISDNRRSFSKKFTKLGYVLIVCCIFSLISSLLLVRISQNAEQKSKVELQKALFERDRINQHKIDLANKNLYDAFAKYGLKYDVAEKRISKLVKDSARINVINGEQPYLYVDEIKAIKKKNEIEFEITFASKMATSYNINTVVDFIKFDSITKKYDYIKRGLELITSNIDIPEGRTSTTTQIYKNVPPNIKYFIFHVRGTYEKSDAIKIKIDKLYMLDLTKKEFDFGEPNMITRKPLEKFIEDNK